MATKQTVNATAKDRALGVKSQIWEVLNSVEQILGDGRKASTVWDKDAGKFASLGRYGIGPLMWSELKPEQQRKMERIIPLRPTNAVQYGDAVIVVGTPDQWVQRRADKATLARQRSAQADTEHSAREMSRELGVSVDDTYVPLPPGAEVGR